MSIKFEQLRSILKSVAPTFRDEAPSKQKYPYIIYEFVNESYARASNKAFAELPMYFIAYVTDGVESELKPLKKALNDGAIPFSSFEASNYDENDERVTQFITYVRCLHDG